MDRMGAVGCSELGLEFAFSRCIVTLAEEGKQPHMLRNNRLQVKMAGCAIADGDEIIDKEQINRRHTVPGAVKRLTASTFDKLLMEVGIEQSKAAVSVGIMFW